MVPLYLLFPLGTATAETLDEYKERMEKEREEARHEHEHHGNDDDDSGGSCFDLGNCCNFTFSLFESMSTDSDSDSDSGSGSDSGATSSAGDGGGACFFDSLIGVRYASYPFAPDSSFDFSTADPSQPGGKIWMAEFSAEGSYLFGQEIPMFDFRSQLSLDAAIFHTNLFFHHLMDADGGSLTSFAAHGGITIPIQNFAVSLYVGAFFQEDFPPYFSYGASIRIFAAGGFVISVYSIFAYDDPFFFTVISPKVELALGRFTIGVGYNYYNYNRLSIGGPTLKTAVWF